MDKLRNHFDSPVIVHSWFRCRAHNNRPVHLKNRFGIYGAGSNDNSWHLNGAAVDFHVKGVENEIVHWYLRENYYDRFGVGLYDWGLHLDMRDNRGGWDERRTTSALYAA